MPKPPHGAGPNVTLPHVRIDSFFDVSEIVHWNPTRRLRPLRRLPLVPARLFGRTVNNFGDLLGPIIVALMLERSGRPPATAPCRRLLTVGSILHLAQPGDVVWGSGRNGRVDDDGHRTDHLDVRAVRGPATRAWLMERGIACPEVFGDPALLLPRLRPDLVELSVRKRHSLTFVSHIDDSPTAGRRGVRAVSPRGDVESLLRTIVQSEFMVATSLHAVVVAEAFGVPARSVVNRSETEFKYADYYLATNRADYRRAATVDEAITLGGERAPDIDLEPLINAFPIDLFSLEAAEASG